MEGLIDTTQISGPSPRCFDLVCLGWDPKVCISNKFPGDEDDGGVGNTLRGLRSKALVISLLPAACSGLETNVE